MTHTNKLSDLTEAKMSRYASRINRATNPVAYFAAQKAYMSLYAKEYDARRAAGLIKTD